MLTTQAIGYSSAIETLNIMVAQRVASDIISLSREALLFWECSKVLKKRRKILK